MGSKFDYSLDFGNIDFRKNPELYRVGRGEQGVLLVQPYKSEILPYWRFRNEKLARESAMIIYGLFLKYLDQCDFVGADMARKFLQMGWTRARRYANYKGGKKYIGPVPQDKKGQSGSHGRLQKPRTLKPDKNKLKAAKIFKKYYDKARKNEQYLYFLEKRIAKT